MRPGSSTRALGEAAGPLDHATRGPLDDILSQSIALAWFGQAGRRIPSLAFFALLVDAADWRAKLAAAPSNSTTTCFLLDKFTKML